MKLDVEVTLPPPKPNTIHIKDMAIGQIGYVRECTGGYNGHVGSLLMRTYHGAVDLTNPRSTFGWGGYKLENECPPNFQIELLPPDSIVTITTK